MITVTVNLIPMPLAAAMARAICARETVVLSKVYVLRVFMALT